MYKHAHPAAKESTGAYSLQETCSFDPRQTLKWVSPYGVHVVQHVQGEKMNSGCITRSLL